MFMGEEGKMWFGGQTRKAKDFVIFHIAMEIKKMWTPPSWKDPVDTWTDTAKLY